MNRRVLEKIKIPETICIPVFGGLLYKYLSKKENKLIKSENLENALNTENRTTKVIVSMTSFPARIEYVHLALKSLVLQSYKADRIILWLAEEQFPNHKLPKKLLELQDYGVEIKWCEDLYGHKKYYYCLLNQKPDEVIITFDDDIIYPVDAIKRLMKKHEEFPESLVCERAQAIDYEKDGTLKNPGRWKTISNIGYKRPSYSLNPSPGGGCLIPYQGFATDAKNKDKIKELAYKNDDLWYMFMAAENKTKTIKTQKYHKPYTLISGSQTVQMATENVVGDRNKIIMNRLAEEYPEAYNRIINDVD